MPVKLNIKWLPDAKVQLSWAAQSGRTYYVQTSTNLAAWADLSGPYAGEDDTTFTLAIPAVGTKSFFRLAVSVSSGSSVETTATAAWNSRYVIVNWENVGPTVQTSRYEIFRNSVRIFTATSTASTYRDNNVSSGAAYRYEVKFFY